MPKSDIKWRKASDYNKIEFPNNLFEAIVLIEWKSGAIGISTFYLKPNKTIVMTGGIIPEYKLWKRFAIISVKANKEK